VACVISIISYACDRLSSIVVSYFDSVIVFVSLLSSSLLAFDNFFVFRKMTDTTKEFASIRVLGTIGWIATGWMIDKVFKIGPDDLVLTFKMAAVAAGVLGVLSFILPDTPPKAKGTTATFRQILGADAFVLFKDSSFTIF